MSDENSFNDTETAFAAGLRAADPKAIDGGAPFVMVPSDAIVRSVEEHLLAPTRARGTITLHDAPSFVRVVNDHCDGGSRIYMTETPTRFVAVLNESAKNEPGWRDHRAVYECPMSVEWVTWTAAHKKAMTQADFAQFIEDNLPDIVSPDSATILEVSRSIEAKKSVAFASAVRLSNGQSELAYEEKIEGTAAKGKLQIPETIVLGIPVLKGGPLYKVEARLRYRIDGSSRLHLWVDLLRAHKVVEHAVAEVRKLIGDSVLIPILAGAA